MRSAVTYNDIKEGDVIETYEMREKPRLVVGEQRCSSGSSMLTCCSPATSDR